MCGLHVMWVSADAKTVTKTVPRRITVVVMTQERVSISMNKEIVAQIKTAAKQAGTTVSGYFERLAVYDVDRRRRADEAWAEIEELNRQAFEAAAQMTEEDMWGNTPPLTPEERRYIEAEIAAADALAKREGRP